MDNLMRLGKLFRKYLRMMRFSVLKNSKIAENLLIAKTLDQYNMFWRIDIENPKPIEELKFELEHVT